MNEKLVLDELRTIKLMCVANFIELQEIRRKLDIAERSPDDRHEFANNMDEHVAAMSEKLNGLIKAGLWEHTLGTGPA